MILCNFNLHNSSIYLRINVDISLFVDNLTYRLSWTMLLHEFFKDLGEKINED